MEIKPLDSGLWSGELRLDVGKATLGECQMRLISLFLSDICEKKFRLLRYENVPLKHHTFPRTHRKKIRRNIAPPPRPTF